MQVTRLCLLEADGGGRLWLSQLLTYLMTLSLRQPQVVMSHPWGSQVSESLR